MNLQYFMMEKEERKKNRRF